MGLPSAGHQAAWQPALCPAGLERETGLEDSNLEGSNVWLRIKVFETNFHSSCAFGITVSSELKVNPAGKQHQPRPQSGIWGSTQWGRVWGWVFLSLKKKKKKVSSPRLGLQQSPKSSSHAAIPGVPNAEEQHIPEASTGRQEEPQRSSADEHRPGLEVAAASNVMSADQTGFPLRHSSGPQPSRCPASRCNCWFHPSLSLHVLSPPAPTCFCHLGGSARVPSLLCCRGWHGAADVPWLTQDRTWDRSRLQRGGTGPGAHCRELLRSPRCASPAVTSPQCSDSSRLSALFPEISGKVVFKNTEPPPGFL